MIHNNINQIPRIEYKSKNCMWYDERAHLVYSSRVIRAALPNTLFRFKLRAVSFLKFKT